jgi:uncharacterized protein
MMAPFVHNPHAELHPFRSAIGTHLLVVDGSRIDDIPQEVDVALRDGLSGAAEHPADAATLWEALGLFAREDSRRFIDGRPLQPPPLRSLSLNIAQSCNMACSYCYADMGTFGGPARRMSLSVARACVDRLLAESQPGADLVLGYMGGEPLLNRHVLHETTRYAAKVAANTGRRIRFSLTTNATLIQPEDAELFAAFPFTVTVSIDGPREQHDALRKMRDGSSGHRRLLEGLRLLNRVGRPRHLSARVTVTPKTGELLPVLDYILSLGFDEVGFAAVLVSPNPALVFTPEDFPLFLERMIACGAKATREIGAGRAYPFGNFETAMHEIHRGSHRPYPCGAGAAYLSASAEGRLFACHRLIDDPKFGMGSVQEGSDLGARALHLQTSHVDGMEPCRDCWARYLCGGGCYHEVSRRGRIGCDYIHGWLDFCLGAYVELSALRPAYFQQLAAPERERVSHATTVSV